MSVCGGGWGLLDSVDPTMVTFFASCSSLEVLSRGSPPPGFLLVKKPSACLPVDDDGV